MQWGKVKAALLAGVAAAAIVAMPTAAKADSILVVQSGGQSQSFACASGSSPATCQHTFVIGNFTASINLGGSNGFPPSITLTSIDIASSTPASISVEYSNNNLKANASSYVQTFAGTLSGSAGTPTTASFETFYDTSNALFNPCGTSTVAGTVGNCASSASAGGLGLGVQNISSTSTAFQASAANLVGAQVFGGTYALTEVYTLNASVTGQNDQLVGSFSIPEPATLSLLGVGLFGMGGIFRRKLGSKNGYLTQVSSVDSKQ